MIPNAQAKAQDLLANDLLKHCFQSQKDQLIYAAMQCGPKEDLERFRFMTALKVIDGVKAHLQALAELEQGEALPDPGDFYKEQSRSKLKALLNLK